MKFTSILPILFLIGYATAMHISITTYANSDCSGSVIISSAGDVKSNVCSDNAKIKTSGNKINICTYTDDNCAQGENCQTYTNGECKSGVKYEVLGSASSVAFSGLFVAAVALFVIAF